LGRGIALYSTLGFGLANALGAPVSGVLYEIGGGRLAFGVATGVVALGAILMAWQIRSSKVQ
jgi:predicted MFS family arabinose efflux permease